MFEMMGLPQDESENIREGTTPLKRRDMARRDLVLWRWKDFYSFYLLDLTRSLPSYLPDPSSVTDRSTGMVVLVSDDNSKRIDWKIAQILEVNKEKYCNPRTFKISFLDHKTKRIEI